MVEPGSGALFELFSANAAPLGDIGRAKGPFRWVNALAHRLRDNAPRKAKQNIAAHYDLGNDFYSAWLDPTMTYSSARFAVARTTASKTRSSARSARCSTGSISSRGSGCSRSAAAGAAGDRGGEARREVVGLTLSTEQKAWAERKIVKAGLPTGSKSAFRIIARRPSSSTPSRRSRWSKRSASAGGAPISTASRATSKPAAARRCNSSASDHELFDLMRATPTSSRPTSSPAACLLDEPRFAALARERGLSWEDREAFRLDYAETLKRWRERYNAAVASGALTGFAEPSTTSGVTISCIAKAASAAARSTSRR